MITIAIAVVSLDGCLTRHDEAGASGWASPEDQDQYRRRIADCDVQIFGSRTYDSAREAMRRGCRPGRLRVVLTREPERYDADEIADQLVFTSEEPPSLLARLRVEGHQRVGVLGGGSVYARFLAADCIDELALTVEPVVFGTGARLAGDAPIDAPP